MSNVITLPPMPAPIDQLWHVLLDLHDLAPRSWSLVGGQMVLLHALEHDQMPPQVSQDGDVVADIRSDRTALTQVVGALESVGFTLGTPSSDGLAHRYVRSAEPRPVVVDVLAPEGLGARADLTTTPPGRTVEMPAGTQALARTELVTVVHEGREGQVPRPTLLAAIVGKAAAVTLAHPQRHYRDLALLCSLVDDPFALADEMTKKDRQRLMKANALLDDGHVAWALVPAEVRARGRIAYGILHG
ncbi:hypothetical protein KV102_07695 [Mumia sp. zg.B53]|uniref:hypothetical protein n=1 Tax=Mumia sp. zg.B53 TaxID=2855449 RepID=UPI001C6EBC0F|nr:hypothetical protein [Mumia sp. zg.B53]MBW9214726.1 hypothetical protein [Mumia sp. zg.B53]